MGFRQGVSSACVFLHEQRQLRCTVHGDDFATVGGKTDLDLFEGQIEAHYECTIVPRLGPGPDDAKECTILNRVVRWTPEGLEYEADPRQAEKLIHECGLEGANSVATPGVKETSTQVAEDKPLEPRLHTAYRSSAARANYLASDRVDTQFPSKEICRWMSAPTQGGWTAMKRLTRFLCGQPRLVYLYPFQDVDAIDVYVDTDWAGCARTRKSTSGGCVMLGRHTIKSWSSTQACVSLSSGEAEFNGTIRGAGMGLGFQSLMADLGHKLRLRVWTDSSAAIGICSRQGLGKLRHLDTHLLWIQQAVRSKRIDLRKIDGTRNPADVFTKHMPSRDKLSQMVQLLGCRYAKGRAASAPQRREGESKKTTMAEAYQLEEHDGPFMPHLAYSPKEMDRLHPSLIAAEDVEVDTNRQEDLKDEIYCRGLVIIEDIRGRMEAEGRRRCSQRPSDAS